MRQYLDETDKINAIRLQLRHPSGGDKVWILVEGESDQKLFGKFISNPNTSVEQVHGGLSSLQKAVKTLVEETKQVIGIRDADFLHLEGKLEVVSSLYLTDYHDAEMMMIASNETLASLIAEYLDPNIYHPETLREEILRSITPLGNARWYNCQHSGSLSFKGLAFSLFYNPANFSINLQVCIQEIHKRSKNREIELEEYILDTLSESTNLLQLCNGHDFERALALFISRRRTKGVSDLEVGKALRLAYTKEEFQKTTLFVLLKEWENNSGYPLFI